MGCLFCKIATGAFNTHFVHEDKNIVAFNDISPQAPHHILIIPKKHIATINDFSDEDTVLVGKLMQTAKKIAHDLKINEEGYRVLMNCNKNGGQAVYHVHFHLLGGRHMSWPPG